MHRFHNILAIVKHAFDGDIVDIFILQAIHLRALKRAHFTVGREHKHIHAFFAAQGIFGRRAGVAAGGAENIERFALFLQHIFKRIAEKLHRHIFKGQRGAVGERFDFDAVAECAHGRDGFCAKRSFGVGAVDDVAQIGRRNIGDKKAHHFKSQIGVAQAAPRFKRLRAHLRVMLGQHQAAIGRQAHQQYFAKRFRIGVATGADVFHGIVSFHNSA